MIAFVSNSSFIDGNTVDGVRLTWAEEFSDIYVYNLRGGVRGKMGETAAREGGNVFDIMTGVAITVLVKTRQNHDKACKIHYAEVADYLAGQEKLDVLDKQRSITGTEFERIIPNSHGDWLNQRDDQYLEYQPIGDKKNEGQGEDPPIFRLFSSGLQTNRDAWCYNFSSKLAASNIQRMISNYNEEVEKGHNSKSANMDDGYVSWTRKLKRELDTGKYHSFYPERVILGVYRPFCRQTVYFDAAVNEYVNQLPQIFPTPEQPNLAFGTIQPSSPKEFSLLCVLPLSDLNLLGASTACQFFPLYTWERLTENSPQESLFSSPETVSSTDEFSGAFDFSQPIGEQVPMIVGEYRRRDNITDATLAAYRQHYHDAHSPQGERISKEDVFFYVYALLHHPEYRERYHADLKKMLPRIPKAVDFWSYSTIGRELAELHVNYERIPAYSSIQAEWSMDTPTDEWAKYHVTKLVWAKNSGKAKDLTRLIYNDYLTFSGIPAEANEYKIGGRSPLEWMVDRYKITTDKKSGIVNDPNDYCREVGDPVYIAKLVPSLVTVSMRTQELIRALPEFLVDEA